jgi:OOP family OmpA-OmpF porin
LGGENARLLFVVNSAAISEDSKMKLSELAKLMSDYPKPSIVIEGHASSDGSMGYNQKLSEKRAESVKNALVEMGVGADRLDTVGYGETKPSSDNNSRGGRAANRRVEFDRKVEIKVAE